MTPLFCAMDGGGFFFACNYFGRMFDNSFPACTFFFFKVEISWCTQIQLFRPRSVHSVSAHCDRVFPDELCVSLFPDRSHTMPGQLQSQLIRTSLGQRCMHIESVTCHLHFWQNDQGLLRATAVTREWNRHRIRVSTQSRLWRRKFSPTTPAGIQTHNLSITSLAL